MDNLKTLQDYLETTVTENMNTVVSEVSNNNTNTVGGGSMSETSNNNMTAMGGGSMSETSNNITDTDDSEAVGSEDGGSEGGGSDTSEEVPETQGGGFLSNIFTKSIKQKDDSKNNELLKLLETSQVSDASPVNNEIDTITMENQLKELLGGKKN